MIHDNDDTNSIACGISDHEDDMPHDSHEPENCDNEMDNNGDRFVSENNVIVGSNSLSISDMRLIPAGDSTEKSGLYEMFAYFDQSTSKSWAGPNFWKARSIKDPKAVQSRIIKQVKVVAKLDFLNFKVDENELFASTKTSISLGKGVLDSDDHNMLPNDLNFNSGNFMKLFLKPDKQVLNFTYRGSHWLRFSFNNENFW